MKSGSIARQPVPGALGLYAIFLPIIPDLLHGSIIRVRQRRELLAEPLIRSRPIEGLRAVKEHTVALLHGLVDAILGMDSGIQR